MLNQQGLYVRTPSIAAAYEGHQPKQTSLTREEEKFMRRQLKMTETEHVIAASLMHKTPYQRIKSKEDALIRRLIPGARVEIKGLMKLQDLNGRTGTVTEPSFDNVMFKIKLEENEEGEFSGGFAAQNRVKCLCFRNLELATPLEQDLSEEG
jgi:hypothetical protein